MSYLGWDTSSDDFFQKRTEAELTIRNNNITWIQYYKDIGMHVFLF